MRDTKFPPLGTDGWEDNPNLCLVFTDVNMVTVVWTVDNPTRLAHLTEIKLDRGRVGKVHHLRDVSGCDL